MCNFFGNNSWLIVIIILILLTDNNNGCGCGCECNKCCERRDFDCGCC